MAVIGTITCPNCAHPANLYAYTTQAQQQWYCVKGAGGCGHFGSVSLRTGEARATSHRTCESCEREFAISTDASGTTQTVCPPCKKLARTYPISFHTCEHCGMLYTRRASSREQHYCSPACSNLASQARMRARRRAGTKKKFNPGRSKSLAIAYQYAYKCHLCGHLIDLSRKPPHPKALHIDHLVPQSEGGTHDTTNLAPAHLECNSHRQHTGPAQLQAFGAH